jgi:hypothetical protein
MSKRTHDDAHVVRLVNNFLTVCLPSLSYTAISIVWGNGCAPMDVHKHPRDDSALSGVVAVGDFRGGGFFTTAWMGGGGEGGAQRQAWMQCGRQIVQGVVVDARKGVIFNAWRTHGPERWEGERYAIVAYTSIAWHRLPAPMRTELLDLGFPW